ncbi:DUF6879 family protein (plasmid) [Streptomyces sp. BI20]|uniref:DUF6879 family protein n=1 Tax=Streptomyces sp. BI20 TaxID=3403460 RepID=UPI003C77F4D1
MPSNVPDVTDLLAGAQHSAVHLELHDSYAVDYETGPFAEWRAGTRHTPEDRAAWWRPWHDLVASMVARGVAVRRARIVSEPVSEYTRFLYDRSFMILEAGEQLRWLPRRQTSGVALPGNDFWLIDGQLLYWNHFAGDGSYTGGEVTEEPAAVKLCADAFEAVWDRAVPHDSYEIR